MCTVDFSTTSALFHANVFMVVVNTAIFKERFTEYFRAHKKIERISWVLERVPQVLEGS